MHMFNHSHNLSHNKVTVEYLLCFSRFRWGPSSRSWNFRAISHEFEPTRAIGLVLITREAAKRARNTSDGNRALNRLRASRFNARIFLSFFFFLFHPSRRNFIRACDICARYRIAALRSLHIPRGGSRSMNRKSRGAFLKTIIGILDAHRVHDSNREKKGIF